MIGFIEKLMSKRDVSRYSKEAKSLGSSIDDGQAMFIWNNGGTVYVNTLKDVRVRRSAEDDMLYADDAKYVPLHTNSVEIRATMTSPPWLRSWFGFLRKDEEDL